jgi:hypothetical protein
VSNSENNNLEKTVTVIYESARELDAISSRYSAPACSHTAFRYGHSGSTQNCKECERDMCAVKICLSCGKEV